MDWKEMLAGMRDDLPGAEEKEGADAGAEIKESEACEGIEAALRRSKFVVSKERKGRAGKTATIIEGFAGNDEELRVLAGELKRHFGCGGSARGGEILLQGDIADQVRRWLSNRVR